MILQAHDLGWDVGRRTVLDGVDMSVSHGEVVGLIGPNGSGKSSLLRLLAGLRRPSRGGVRLDGVDLRSVTRRDVARRIAFVEQTAVTDQNPTVADALDLGRTPHRRSWSAGSSRDRRVIDKVASETDIEALLGERYGSLSGGERQRVQIARAFVQEPEVMILDEPTNHLDVKYQLSLLDLVATHVRRTSAAAVVALHDLNLAATYCDRIVVLADGCVVDDGPPRVALTEKTIESVFDVHARIVDEDGLWIRVDRR